MSTISKLIFKKPDFHQVFICLQIFKCSALGQQQKAKLLMHIALFFGFLGILYTQPVQLIYDRFYSRISMVVMFYKVTANIEFANTDYGPWGNTGSGSCKPLVTTCSSSDHFITLFYVFLFKDTVIYSVDSLTLIS